MTTNGTSTSYNTTSDKRLKENLKEVDSPLDRVNQIEVYEYNYKTKPDDTMEGFLAQQLEEIVPYAVTGKEIPLEEDDEDNDGLPDNPMSVDYSKVVPLITAAVKELFNKFLGLFESDKKQNREIASLKEENEKMKASHLEQEKKIEALEKENKKMKEQFSEMMKAICEVNSEARGCGE